MKKYLIGAAVVALTAGVALAQAGPMGRTMTRAEVPAMVQKMFARLDVNHDGVIDQAEMAAAAQGGGRWGHGDGEGDRGGDRDGDHKMDGDHGAGRDPNAMFDRMDLNHDGMISRAEFAQVHQMRDQKRMADGAADPGMNGHGMNGRDGGGHGGMMAHMVAMADVNHDGRITLPEATAAAYAHFDMVDTNHDGTITPEERMAAHAKMQAMRTGQPG